MATSKRNMRTAVLGSRGTNIADTLAQRGKIHGDFTDNAELSQSLKQLVHGSKNVQLGLLNAAQLEAMEVIMAKASRILTGDCNEPDHWHDIAGYATLARDRCEQD